MINLQGSYKYVVIAFLIITIGIFSIGKIREKNHVLKVSASVLSNKTIGWGMKRGKENKQPDFGKENIENMKSYGGIYVGNSNKKTVYLTFDLGYEAGYTENMLETLEKNNVKATFFITGHYLNTNTELVKKMVNDGHIIGNHGVSSLMSIN